MEIKLVSKPDAISGYPKLDEMYPIQLKLSETIAEMTFQWNLKVKKCWICFGVFNIRIYTDYHDEINGLIPNDSRLFVYER